MKASSTSKIKMSIPGCSFSCVSPCDEGIARMISAIHQQARQGCSKLILDSEYRLGSFFEKINHIPPKIIKGLCNIMKYRSYYVRK